MSSVKGLKKSRSCKAGGGNNKIRLFFLLLAAILFIYIAVAILVSVRSGVTTVIATNGSVSEGFRTSGYVYRNQEIITSPGGGYFECLVSDGERVKKGQTVAYLFGSRPDASLMEKIRNVSKLISEKSGKSDVVLYSGDTSSTLAVAEKVRDMSDLRSDRDLSDIRKKKSELNMILSGNTSGTDGSKTLEELKTELAELRGQAGNGAEIIAPSAGVFSSRIDGYEDALKYDKISTVTASEIEEIGKIKPTVSEEVAAGQPLCKIINNYTWAYVTLADEKEAEGINVGQKVEMQFFDLTDTSVEGSVSRISDADNGKKAVVITTNKYVDRIYSTSCVNANVILVNATGIKLPAKSLHVNDGVTGVYVLRLGVAKFVPVNVKYKNDEWVVVSAAEPGLGEAKLQIYDEVIVSGKNIEDGKVVR